MYDWVSEGSIRKYNRAVAQLEKENAVRKAAGQPLVELTEEAIKTLYVKWQGLVLGEPESVKGVTAGDEEAANARAEEVEKPKRVKRKK